MSDRASSPNLIESGLNGLKSLIGGGRDNYPLISGTNGKHQIYVSCVTCVIASRDYLARYSNLVSYGASLMNLNYKGQIYVFFTTGTECGDELRRERERARAVRWMLDPRIKDAPRVLHHSRTSLERFLEREKFL
jgi:hypothetical protein